MRRPDLGKDEVKTVFPRGQRFLNGAYRRQTVLNTLLLPASAAYVIFSALAKKRRKAKRESPGSGCTVISIGNIEVGGTGKTPFAMHILDILHAEGARPVYISRGYRSIAEKLGAVTVVAPAQAENCPVPRQGVRFVSRSSRLLYRKIGDEGAVVARILPQIPLLFSSDKKRAVGVARAYYSPTHIILDDAFQSWNLYRDLDIVLVDALNPFGKGRVIPAGTLREGAGGLRRADLIGVSAFDDDGPGLESQVARMREFLGHSKPVFTLRRSLSLVSPHGGVVAKPTGKVASVSSIALPERFEQGLVDNGCDLGLSIRFPDHHFYSSDDVRYIDELLSKEGISTLVTTEKDWVKLEWFQIKNAEVILAKLQLSLGGADVLAVIKKPQNRAAVF